MTTEWHHLQQFHSNSLKSLRVKRRASLTYMWSELQFHLGCNCRLCLKSKTSLYIIQRALWSSWNVKSLQGKWVQPGLSRLALQHTEVFSNSESSLMLPVWACWNYPGAQSSFKILLLKRNEICHSCQCNNALHKFRRFLPEKLTTKCMNIRLCHKFICKISRVHILRAIWNSVKTIAFKYHKFFLC